VDISHLASEKKKPKRDGDQPASITSKKKGVPIRNGQMGPFPGIFSARQGNHGRNAM
jgi:hypothetical protein